MNGAHTYEQNYPMTIQPVTFFAFPIKSCAIITSASVITLASYPIMSSKIITSFNCLIGGRQLTENQINNMNMNL